jgi:hypothetical protein
MGTKFRTMLAPINRSTGDGRRFATDSMSVADTPFPFEWVRERQGGHDGAVAVGVVQQAAVMSVGKAIDQGFISPEAANRLGLDHSAMGVFGQGELFDDADRETMPQLAEDVATVLHLADQGILGPSVDLDSFEAVPVEVGSDVPVTWDRMMEAEDKGEELKLELLITAGRVRAGTLVTIPAFVETSAPLELIQPEGAEATAEETAALVASIATDTWTPDATMFEPEPLTGLTEVTYDWERGKVYGHVAPHGTCHVGFRDTCVTPPVDPTGAYARMHRYPVETADGGIVWAGRLSVGGRHPELNLTASQAVAQYEGKTTAAHIVVREDAFGFSINGPINPALTEGERLVLERRTATGERPVSGDWREYPEGLSMIDVLALSPGPRQHSEPGFPVTTYVRNGRQVALTASFGLGALASKATSPAELQAAIRATMRAENERERALAALREAVTVDEAARAAEARAALAAEIESGSGAAARECEKEG